VTRPQALLAAIAGILAASILLGLIHPFGNPLAGAPGDPRLPWGQATIPAGVHAVFLAKCADCHSLATRTPVYAHFAPASWLIERDIVRARSAMNLSHWDDDSKDQQQILMAKIAEVTSKRKMPPPQYLVLHWNARLTNADLQAIAEWVQTPSGQPSPSGAPMQGDAVRGKAVFEKRCTGCHAFDQDREGPRLTGVYGRTAGSVPGFGYSTALRNSHIVWDEATLERWLTDPQTMVPGADMDFYVAKPDERADVIEFLKEQSRQAMPSQPR
jgi:cytochrome c